jgi:hypothetical protein
VPSCAERMGGCDPEQAKMYHDHKVLNLGSFPNAAGAARAHDQKQRELRVRTLLLSTPLLRCKSGES